MIHRGEIVEKIIKEKGIIRKELAKKLGVSSRQLYNYLSYSNLELEIIIDIGKIISYDFSFDIPELGGPRNMVREPNGDYKITTLADCMKEAEEWKAKYVNILEKYTSVIENMQHA